MPTLLVSMMLLTGPGCNSHYNQGVREWAQPTQQLLAQRVDDAMAAQDRALTSLEKMPETRPMDDDRGLNRDQISLHIYRFGQSVTAIRDVLKREGNANTGAVANLAEDLANVQIMMDQYLAQQTQQNAQADSTITLAQLQQAVRTTEDDAQTVMGALQRS